MSAQLKVKTKIVVEQEKKVQEKERECEQMNSEMQKVKKELTDAKDELGKVNQTLKQKSSELDEANKKLGKQEGCMVFLNTLLFIAKITIIMIIYDILCKFMLISCKSNIRLC